MGVRTDAPVIPLTQYDPNAPPYVPAVSGVPNDMSYLITLIAGSVCNEAAVKAFANPGRMACYNILANNYWNNAEFAELVKLIFGYMYLEYRKGNYRMIDHALQDAVHNLLSAYTSVVIMTYPEVKSVCSPQIVSAASQNVNSFNNIKQEIYSMYNNQMGGNMPSSLQMGANGHAPMQAMNQQPQFQWVQTPQGMVAVPVQMQPQPAQYYQPPQFSQPPFGQFPQQPQGNTFGNTGFNGGNVFGNVNTAEAIKQDRFISRLVNTSPIIESAPVIQNEQPALQAIDKDSEMERNRHRIMYFDEAYVTTTVVRNALLEKGARQLATAEVRSDNECAEVYKPWLIEVSLETAVLAGRIKRLSQGEKQTAFRCFAMIAKPILSDVDIASYFAEIYSGKTFSEVAIKIKAIAESLTKSGGDDYGDKVIAAMYQLDRVLTELVNKYLYLGLDLPNLRIDSFVTDAPDLPGYLLQKYGQRIHDSYREFENKVIDCITVDNDCIKSSEVAHSCLEIPEGLYVAYIPLNYSLTYVPATSKEVKVYHKHMETKMCEEESKWVFDLKKSLDLHKKDLGYETMYDLVVTTDGELFQLHQDSMKTKLYLFQM